MKRSSTFRLLVAAAVVGFLVAAANVAVLTAALAECGAKGCG
jgi:hypothetical protein